jgi:DNA-directed RNA polymerase specialized sigma24 family protein
MRNHMTDRHFVRTQKLKTVSGSSGAYEKWVQNHPTLHSKGKLGDRFDNVTEDVRANPDSLREDESMYGKIRLTRPQEVMGEAVEHLQGRQREVYVLLFRTGLSFSEVSKKLRISKSAVQIYKTRALAFVTQYCGRALARGL